MSYYSTKDKHIMLALAREAIESHLGKIKRRHMVISPKLMEKRACFVTLTVHGQLHGCIGHILPTQELYKDIWENAQAAAFDDTRFTPLSKEELQETDIEISILTIPQPFPYQNPQELVQFLEKEKPGVILSRGVHHATFLPDVWDDIPDPQAFLLSLCLKAGLPQDAWMQGVTLQYYRTIVVKA